jgi:hypothetical protein
LDLLSKKRKAAELISFMKHWEPIWKFGSDVHHLNKRIRRGHLPGDFTIADMNQLIRDICTFPEHETYVYYKDCFEQDYFVFGDGVYWIVIVGENGIMETLFPPDSYSWYLDPEFGYQYLGTIKEVLQHG